MKKQKIVITGGVGYIATELCNLYSGEARYKDIVVIDNKFLSARVKQLSDWGIKFIYGDIRDREFMQTVLEGADVVYHLASITDVAYTKKHETEEKELLINSVGIDGLSNVLQFISPDCKLLFPSSHTVYDGLQETRFDLTEEEFPQPGLMYSGMKTKSEEMIRESTSNHVIARLASVYGLSGDNMRINIMPNLFSKIASQDGTISMYGGGVQHKSLINNIDVVRAMKHLVEGYHTGTYHLSNENTTVGEVAAICKKINPKVTLISTDDEIPNKGYTLSNQKLLDTGFKFLYNIEDSIREMITAWSYRDTATPLEYIDEGGNCYIDDRGVIRNYELTEHINLIGYIESKTGSVRANHYHPIQEQKCLLISGRYISVTKDLSYPDAHIEYKVIRPGNIAIIRPNVAHTMVFLQDSIFLNLVRGERNHGNYGVTHTIPYTLVDNEHRDRILEKYRIGYKTDCRGCGSKNLEKVLSLGDSPLANSLLDTPDQECDMYPLEWMYCSNCYNIQLSIVVPPEKMFDNYLYVSSTSPVFRQHFEQAAEQYIEQFNLTSDSVVWDIGSNDGIALKPLQDRGIRVCGIEPADNLAQLANSNGIHTIHGYFGHKTGTLAYQQIGSPIIVTASNVFAHADNLADITRAVFSNLQPGGVFIIEVQYLMDTIHDLTFDNIYHEHVNYWSVHALNTFFERLGYRLFHVEHIDTHGGSIRCYIDNNVHSINSNVDTFIQKEYEQGVYAVGTFIQFGRRVSEIRDVVRKNITLLKQKFPLICGYGSPAKATTALNYFGITKEDIEYTIEDNTLKCGKYLPGVNIPIGSHNYGPPQTPNLCIVLAWNFYDSIVKRHEYMIKNGMQFISIKDLEIPEMPIMDTKVTELTGQPITGKVYDCFMFFNELDTLEMRLSVHDSIVDYFVICEARVTHSGIRREPIFPKHMNSGQFSRFLPKIKYLLLDSIPNDFHNLPLIEEYTNQDRAHNKMVGWYNSSDYVDKNNLGHCREWYQRDSMIEVLVDCSDADIIMMSELDEIYNPTTIKELFTRLDPDHTYGARMNSYYYYLNLLKEKHWVGGRIATYKKFSTFRTSEFRHYRDIIVANSGWHFSFQGSTEQIKQKMLSYCHFVAEDSKTIKDLQGQINEWKDPFDRGGKLKRVEIDDTYPKYLLENLEYYKHMIL